MLALPGAARACSNASASYDQPALPALKFCNNETRYERIYNYLRRPVLGDGRQTLASEPGVVQLQRVPLGSNTIMSSWRAEAGSLWVFLGPVGSFKSSVLEVVAGHSAIAAGASVSVGGTMSYMPQAAWIQQATIRENIVCNETWDESRFNAILHACALEHDVKAMPLGSDTVVAEKGLNLSGGQKQRLALARAAYRRADIYVLDNPVSAIDDQTQQHIWRHLIEGLLCDSTIIVASSRPVISCTAIVHMSTNGVVGDPQYVNGWCSSTPANDAPLRRYSEPRAHPREFRSRVSESPAMSCRSSVSSVVDAAVCDVRSEVREYEAHASRIEADSGSSSKRIELQHSYASSVIDRGTVSVRCDASQRRPGSFLQQLKNKQSIRGDSAMFHGSDADLLLEDREEVSYSQPRQRDLKQPLLSSLASSILKTDISARDHTITSSKVGVIQFTDACKLGGTWLFLIIMYPAYQLCRTYVTPFLQCVFVTSCSGTSHFGRSFGSGWHLDGGMSSTRRYSGSWLRRSCVHGC